MPWAHVSAPSWSSTILSVRVLPSPQSLPLPIVWDKDLCHPVIPSAQPLLAFKFMTPGLEGLEFHILVCRYRQRRLWAILFCPYLNISFHFRDAEIELQQGQWLCLWPGRYMLCSQEWDEGLPDSQWEVVLKRCIFHFLHRRTSLDPCVSMLRPSDNLHAQNYNQVTFRNHLERAWVIT